MRPLWIVPTLVATLCAAPLAAQAGKVEGVGIGAGVGAIVAGPVGAVVAELSAIKLAARTSLAGATVRVGATTGAIVIVRGAEAGRATAPGGRTPGQRPFRS